MRLFFHSQIQPGLSFPLLFSFTNAVPFIYKFVHPASFIDPLHLQIQPGLSFPLPFPFTNAAFFPFTNPAWFVVHFSFTNAALFIIYKYSQVCRSLISSHLQMWYHLLLIPITNLFIRPLFIEPLHLQIQSGLSFCLSSHLQMQHHLSIPSFTNTATDKCGTVC